VARLAGVAYTRLDRWLSEWGVEPTVRAAAGPGVVRLYDEQTGFGLWLVTILHRRAAPCEVIRAALRLLARPDLPRRLAAGENMLVWEGDRVRILSHTALHRWEHTGHALVCDLAVLWDRWRAALADVDRRRAAQQQTAGATP
jgi:hypothetical protein